MSNLAINDAGDVIAFDGREWKPAPMAQNDQGQKVVYNGSAWQPLDQLLGASKAAQGAERGKGGGVDNFGRSLARGASFGLADEIAAAGDATVGPAADWVLGKLGLGKTNTSTAGSWGERYNQNLAAERGQNKAYDENFPVWSGVGQVAGNVAASVPLLAAAPALTSVGPSVFGNAAKMAAVGGTMGAVQGFNEGEGGFGDRVANSVVPGAAGAVVGGALPIAGAAGRRFMETGMGRSVSEKVVSPLARKMAGMMGEATPIKSLSAAAAAPDGNPGVFTQIAENTGSAAQTGAVRRLTTALQRSGMSPDDVRARLRQLGPEATLADVEEQFFSAARAANTMPGETKSVARSVLEGRARQAGNRMTEVFNGTEPAPSAFALRGKGQAFDQNLRAVGQRAYAAMDDAGLKQTPELMALYENPDVSAAITRILDAEKRTRIGTTREPASPVEIMHKVKQAIWDLGFDGPNARSGPNASWYRDLGTQYVDALKRANPKLAEADKLYSQAASLPEYFDTGAKLLARDGASTSAIEGSAPALADMLSRANPQQVLAARSGATNAARSQAQESTRLARALAQRIDESAPVQSKLNQLYGPDWARNITRQAAAEKTFAKTENRLLNSTSTADKIAEVVGEGAPAGLANVPAGSVGSRLLDAIVGTVNKITAANEPVRNVIGRATLNMDPSEKERFLRLIADELARRQQASPFSASLAGSSGSLLPSNR